jgi:hypothetical protein
MADWRLLAKLGVSARGAVSYLRRTLASVVSLISSGMGRFWVSTQRMTLVFSITLALLLAVLCGAYFYIRYHAPLKYQVLCRELTLTKDYAEKLHSLSYKILDRGFAINGTLPMDEEFDKREPVDNREIGELTIEELEERLDSETGSARRSQGTIGRRRELVGEIARRKKAKTEERVEVSAPVFDDTQMINSLDGEQVAHLESLKGAN